MKKIVQTSYAVHIQKASLPASRLRIVFLSDLHNDAGDEEIRAVLAMLQRAKPDLLLVGGDMIVAKPEHSVEPGLHFMQRLAKKWQIYAGTGNHEYRARIYPEKYGEMFQSYTEPLKEAGVIFLSNEARDLSIGELPVRLAGFDLPRKYYKRFRAHKVLPTEELTSAIGEPTSDRLNILLAHDPSQLSTYFGWGAELVLSGHYHGGILRLGGNRGLVAPSLKPFPAHAYGLISQGGRHMVISAGLGAHTIPFRLNNPREVVMIDLFINQRDKQAE